MNLRISRDVDIMGRYDEEERWAEVLLLLLR